MGPQPGSMCVMLGRGMLEQLQELGKCSVFLDTIMSGYCPLALLFLFCFSYLCFGYAFEGVGQKTLHTKLHTWSVVCGSLLHWQCRTTPGMLSTLRLLE